MTMNISLKNKHEIEVFVLLANLGISKAIKEGALSIEDAEEILYNPYSINKLNELLINDEIVNLIYLGCELEDVESLIPEKLDKSITKIIDKTIETMKMIKGQDDLLKKWID